MAIKERRRNPGLYNLYSRDCAPFVVDVLEAGGVKNVPHSAKRGWSSGTCSPKRSGHTGTRTQHSSDAWERIQQAHRRGPPVQIQVGAVIFGGDSFTSRLVK